MQSLFSRRNERDLSRFGELGSKCAVEGIEGTIVRTAGVAVNVGFDWVYHEKNIMSHSQCRIKAMM